MDSPPHRRQDAGLCGAGTGYSTAGLLFIVHHLLVLLLENDNGIKVLSDGVCPRIQLYTLFP